MNETPHKETFIAKESSLKNSDSSKKKNGLSLNLSSKLLVLTIGFVMLSEIFVFVPSVAKFRNDWLTDRLTRSRTVLLMLDDYESAQNPEEANAREMARIEEAIRSFDVITLAHKKDGMRQLIAMINDSPAIMEAHFDVHHTGPWQSIKDAFGTLLSRSPRTILVTGSPPGSNQLFEAVVLEQPLRQAMLRYTRNVMILSFIISVLTASMVYFSLSKLFVRPIKRMADNMIDFTKNPELVEKVIMPCGRGDEIGVAEERLRDMQLDLQTTLSNQKRLASLGLAVSKINHDLRNILASVQLFSDRLTRVPDPEVQRFAPKLIAGIDRAIGYCQSTLVYSSAKEEAPNRHLIKLYRMTRELENFLDVAENNGIEWNNKVSEEIEIYADYEQIFRVLMNLSRNAIKVMEKLPDEAPKKLTIEAESNGNYTSITIRDTGPGLPEEAKKHLFEAFRGSVSQGGTGLGLAIAYEIINQHGGKIFLRENSEQGATFQIDLPSRKKSDFS